MQSGIVNKFLELLTISSVPSSTSSLIEKVCLLKIIISPSVKRCSDIMSEEPVWAK